MLCAETELPLVLKLGDLLSHALQSHASCCGPYSQQIRLLLGFLVGSWMEPAAEPVYTFEYTSPISLIPSNPQHPSLKDLANGMSS